MATFSGRILGTQGSPSTSNVVFLFGASLCCKGKILGGKQTRVQVLTPALAQSLTALGTLSALWASPTCSVGMAEFARDSAVENNERQ